MIATLRIQVLFYWESQQARALAGRLYRTFSARPTGDGPRIPVRFGPRQPDGGASAVELGADHEIFVILVDERMARRARSSDRTAADSWAERARELLRDHAPGTGSPHHVLPVALDSEALQLSPALSAVSFVRLDVAEGEAKDRHLVLHIAIRALRALQELPRLAGKPADEYPDIPVQLFISHAKKDLPRDSAAMAEGPVRAILAKLRDLPLAGWYDAAEIPAGGRFPEEIEKGVLKSSALVTVVTDAWSTREWCRREVLEAKLAARPLIIVDALEARVVRLFPYVGNAMTLRWRAAIAAPSGPATEAWKGQRALWEAEDSALVIEAALLEALRYQHDHARLRGLAGENEVALGAPPEALTLAHLPAGTKRVWYPDPPLGQEELAKLQPAAGDPKHRIELTTPLTL
jgi:hypothetical protein